MSPAPWSDKTDGEALLDLLAQLIQAHGPAPLLTAPLIMENTRCFPDPWEPTLLGIARILHRLLHYVGLSGLDLEVIDARVPLEDDNTDQPQPVIELIEIRDGRIVVQVDHVGRAEWVPAVLCYEVARAFVLTSRGRHPYRGGDLSTSDLSDLDQKRAAAATVFLGLGLITVNAAHAFLQEGEIVGYMAVTRRARLVLGALRAGDLSFLLAVQLLLKGYDSASSRPLLSQMELNQTLEVRRWLDALAGGEGPLRRRLGLPEEVEPEAPRLDVPPLPEHTVAALRQAEDRSLHPLKDVTAPRLYQNKTLSGFFIGTIVSIVPAFVVPGVAYSVNTVAIGATLLVGGAAAGAVIGSRRRLYTCGACGMILRGRQARCPKCGARLEEDKPWVRRASRPADLDEEEDDDELARQALEQEQRDFGKDGHV